MAILLNLVKSMCAQFGRDPTAVSKKVYFNFISIYAGIVSLMYSHECINNPPPLLPILYVLNMT